MTLFAPRLHRIEHPDCGLLAFVVIDDTSLGPAAGGIRTRRYDGEEAARADASALARAMTYKCALAGLPAGGGKGVVMLSDGLDRERGFERLGEFVDGLGGRFLTAGDLGTTRADLEAMARRTPHVCTDERGLGDAVGRGCLRAVQACVTMLAHGSGGEVPVTLAEAPGLEGVRIAVQGCGTVGAAVARAARRQGAEVIVADLDAGAARALADDIDAEVAAPDRILDIEADVLAPCAVGGVLDTDAACRVRVGAVCGAANNILSSDDVERVLSERGIIWVPDALSSAGAVILGVGRRLLGLESCDALIDQVFDTTLEVVSTARRRNRYAGELARELAESRILAARGVA